MNPAVVHDEPDSAPSAARLGEQVRRAALGLTAALLTARAYTTSEPDLERGAGAGLTWVLAVLIVAGLALAAGLIGGRFRFRWGWADLAVVALTVLVAFSSLHSLDRRPAINLAWEWIALGVMYLLLRNLPRTRAESSVLAGAMVATAFAVSVYGLFQGGVELPQIREEYRRNPTQFLLRHPEVGVAPGTPQQSQFEDRLLGSNEITSTFALANSLAGFVVGPLVAALVVWLLNLFDRETDRPGWPALLMAAPVILSLLVALILTKSRSGYIGLLVGLAIVAWSSRGRVSRRLLIGVGVAGLAIVVLLAAAGLATGKLDREVLTQAPLSMRYRLEFWQATWSVITGGASNPTAAVKSPTFWSGVGPANFRSAYLRYKLPWSSEEILDPHDMFLEVWATAGFWAVVALALALGVGLRALLGPSSVARPRPRTDTAGPDDDRSAPGASRDVEEDRPPPRARWLVLSAWAGGILAVLLGMMNLFAEGLFVRWLILGASWLAAVLLGGSLWRRRPIPALAMGAAVAAVAVNLLAAGGIGIPTVALGLWSTLAIGLNLREDRPCGRLRERPSRVPPFVLSTVWAAAIGLFLGAVIPFWQSEAAIAEAEDALRRQPPNFDAAEAAYKRAVVADRYYARPWLGYADLAYQAWDWRGSRPDDLRWKMVPELLEDAVRPPRNPISWSLHLRRAEAIRQLLRRVGADLKPLEVIRYQGEVVKEIRTASTFYPSNARLHAWLAEASAEISMTGDAVKEAEEALRLDGLNPHRTKKLTDAERERLEAIRAK